MTGPIAEHCWTTRSAEQTLALGAALGRSVEGGTVIGLVGQLGAGKTQLVKGIATGNGLDDAGRVTSPTFTLVHQYPGRVDLVHVDAYRLAGTQDMLDLGFDEWMDDRAVIVIEWADRVRSAIPDESIWIEFRATGETQRELVCTARGEAATSCLDAVRGA